MKKVLSVLFLMVFAMSVFGQDSEPEPAKFKITWDFVVALVMGFYELLVRLIPTYKNWSIIGKILEFLLWLSKLFNVEKKLKK